MSPYLALAGPSKEAALGGGLLRRGAKSLFRNGFWSTAARGGEKLVARGGRGAILGKGIAGTANTVKKVSPVLGAYGMAGMVADPFGYDLPGSELAFNTAMPGWGALVSAPGAIRSGRLASGDYDAAIKEDAQAGARYAGQHFIEATQRDGRTAYDADSFKKFLDANGIDTRSAERYTNGEPLPRPSWWHRLGNTFNDPTANVIPHVQQGILDQMNKGASDEMEKQAWMAAARGAWKLRRAVGSSAARGVGLGKGALGAETGNRAHAAWDATKAVAKARPTFNRVAGGAFTTAMVGSSALDGYDAVTSDKPYDEERIQQEGYDGAQAAIRDRLSKLTPFERRMAQMDPSLSVNRLEQQMPGSIAGWEQQKGQPYQQGILGSVSQAWQGRGTPEFYSTDSSGNRHYL